MEDNNNNITKLIILVAGLSTIAFLAYLVYVYKSNNKIAIPSQLALSQQRHPDELYKIEQKLIQLEVKLDSLSTTKNQPQTQLQSQSQSERTIVSMGKSKQANAITKMRTVNTREMFDMR